MKPSDARRRQMLGSRGSVCILRATVVDVEKASLDDIRSVFVIRANHNAHHAKHAGQHLTFDLCPPDLMTGSPGKVPNVGPTRGF